MLAASTGPYAHPAMTARAAAFRGAAMLRLRRSGPAEGRDDRLREAHVAGARPFGANGLTDYRQKRVQHEQLQKEIVALQEQNSRLQDHVNHLKSDPDAIEHEARVIMRYAKPGEIIYALNDKPAAK